MVKHLTPKWQLSGNKNRLSTNEIGNTQNKAHKKASAGQAEAS